MRKYILFFISSILLITFALFSQILSVTYTQLPPIRPKGPFNPNWPQWTEYRRRENTDKRWQWNVAINFYGKVVDENDRPVEGVTINCIWTDSSQKGTSHATLKTDKNGSFALVEKTGKALQVRIEKEGYYNLRENPISFEYADFYEEDYHIPDPKKPVIFHLRKKGEGASLLYHYSEVSVPWNNSFINFDFLKGKAMPSDHLQISGIKSTQRDERGHFDWKVTLTIPDGGFIEHNDEFPFNAPESGYQSSLVFDKKTSQPDWSYTVEKYYYFVFDQPKRYGRMRLYVKGNSNVLFIDYFVNPNNSRNLEADANESGMPK